MSHGIFYERQHAGMCRKHVLNAFFGYLRISTGTFNAYMKEYDEYLQDRFNTTTSSASFDIIHSDQTTLVSWVLRQQGIHCRYYPLNSLYGKGIDHELRESTFLFIYSDSHIWGIRLKDGVHYTVDSTKGVAKYDINMLRSVRNVGVMMPVTLKSEWARTVAEISTILDKHSISDKNGLVTYLTKLQNNGDVLGGFEIPLNVAIRILETNKQCINAPGFEQLSEIVNRYNDFLRQFTRGQYNNTRLVLVYVPGVIMDILSLE